MIIREVPPGDTAQAFAAMHALRPHVRDVEAFVHRVDVVQRPEGYRLVAAFEHAGGEAVAVAGFRIGHNLAWGRYLYVDDLSTSPTARRRGHGAALLDWLMEEARSRDCDQLHLDSGVVPDRADAHRLYLNHRMRITSFHFARPTTDEPPR